MEPGSTRRTPPAATAGAPVRCPRGRKTSGGYGGSSPRAANGGGCGGRLPPGPARRGCGVLETDPASGEDNNPASGVDNRCHDVSQAAERGCPMPEPEQSYRRDETTAGSADRRYSELLQELRVSQTGIQVRQQKACVTAVFAIACGQRLVDLLALRADRVALRVAVRHPDLAAQRDHRRARHRALKDLVFLHVVGEPFVVAVAMGQIRLLVSLSGKTFMLTRGDSTRLGTRPRVSSAPGRRGRSRPGPGRRPAAAARPARAARARAANASSGSAASTYQAPSSISA